MHPSTPLRRQGCVMTPIAPLEAVVSEWQCFFSEPAAGRHGVVDFFARFALVFFLLLTTHPKTYARLRSLEVGTERSLPRHNGLSLLTAACED
jgi:hypothetical protein